MLSIQASLSVAREAIARHEAAGPTLHPIAAPSARKVVLVVEDDQGVVNLIEKNSAIVARGLLIDVAGSLLGMAQRLTEIARAKDAVLVGIILDVELPDGRADTSPLVCAVSAMPVRRLIFTGYDAAIPGFETIQKGDSDAWPRVRRWLRAVAQNCGGEE
jgi:hypothetical protein